MNLVWDGVSPELCWHQPVPSQQLQTKAHYLQISASRDDGEMRTYLLCLVFNAKCRLLTWQLICINLNIWLEPILFRRAKQIYLRCNITDWLNKKGFSNYFYYSYQTKKHLHFFEHKWEIQACCRVLFLPNQGGWSKVYSCEEAALDVLFSLCPSVRYQVEIKSFWGPYSVHISILSKHWFSFVWGHVGCVVVQGRDWGLFINR